MKSGLPGEGYRMTTADGTRYYFDVATSRTASALERRKLDEFYTEHTYILHRTQYYLLASKIEDRLGNTVEFEYSGSGFPTRIWSSDGREILLNYSGGRLSTAVSNGRTWQYQYISAYGAQSLSAVTLPDASKWRYAYVNDLLPPGPPEYETLWLPECMGYPAKVDASFVLTSTHPSGAVGTFSFENMRHYRSGVAANECQVEGTPPTASYNLLTPNYFDVMSILTKTIGGELISQPSAWQYNYGVMFEMLWGSMYTPSSYPCTTCTTEKTVTVTNPDNTKTLHRFGVLYTVNDGRALGTQRLDGSNNVVQEEVNQYLSESDAPSQAFYGLYGAVLDGSDPSTARIRPVIKRTTTLQSRNFIWEVPMNCGLTLNKYCFDTYARPSKVVKSSSP
jgi:hypothetical protein